MKTAVKGSIKWEEQKTCDDGLHGTIRKTWDAHWISGDSLHGSSLAEMLKMDGDEEQDEMDAKFCAGWMYIQVMCGKWISRRHPGQ